MKVQGHFLPVSFINAPSTRMLHRDVGSWELKGNKDSFGGKLETELAQVFSTEAEIVRETESLPNHFQPDGYYGEISEWSNQPGYIEDITDFAHIVAFAISGDGAPFCFDYRSSNTEPSIIWWDDIYWRKLSDNFDDFLGLFELHHG